MNRAELYEDIIRALKGVKEVKHIDLWNRNVEFISVEDWPTPAVFIEFGTIRWQAVKSAAGVSWRGSGNLKIHIVTEWHGSSAASAKDRALALKDFGLSGMVQSRIEALMGEGYDSLTLTDTLTNHDHEVFVENIDIYSVKFLRKIKDLQR